jgi:hypothetical protein
MMMSRDNYDRALLPQRVVFQPAQRLQDRAKNALSITDDIHVREHSGENRMIGAERSRVGFQANPEIRDAAFVLMRIR